MKINKVVLSVGQINGGASGEWTELSGGEVNEVRGIVKSSTMTLYSGGSKVQLMIGRKTYELSATAIPRIDVGEEVILHLDGDTVVAFQVIRDEEVVFRCLLPQERFRHGSRSYAFTE